MKKSAILLAAAGLIALSAASCNTPAGQASGTAAADSTIAPGSIVFFNLDRVIAEYDMANDLRTVVETKVNSIQEEVNRRGSKLDKDAKSFQDKVNKGLLTQSTAEAQYAKLQEQQNSFQTYAAQKQQEIAEEQQVMMNQIADAIKTFVEEYNTAKGYGMILATQGEILPIPVVSGSDKLDITDDLLEGLNAAYVKEKGKTE